VALLPVSVAADSASRWTARRSLADVAWWTLLVAGIVTPLTAATGWWLSSLMQHPPEQNAVLVAHQWIGSALALLYVALTAWRGILITRNTPPGWAYLLCGSAIVLITGYQGHLGGSMTFG